MSKIAYCLEMESAYFPSYRKIYGYSVYVIPIIQWWHRKVVVRLHKKRNQLIDFLLNQNREYVSASALAEILNVTDRTIRNYIKDINESFSDIAIISSPQGYKLLKDDSQIDQERVGSTNKEMEEVLLEFEIIQFLMNEDRYTTYDEIADQFYYSPQTIRSRMQRLTMNIDALGIDVSIDTKVFKGMKLIGTEMQKRILLESFLRPFL